jgi:V8-like Glu-specific endopeptidase
LDPPPLHSESVGESITNGTNDGSDPAVVALVDANNTTLCTGTLISPQVVLTAAHCLEGETTGVDDRVFFGSSVASGGTFISVSGVQVHPQYDPTTLANDLALLALVSRASATPVPLLAPTPDASLANAQVRIVGFGDTGADAGDFGVKRTGTSTVASVTATTLELAAAPSQQCFGDSGGPALLTVGGVEYLAAVTSHGDTACVASDFDTRVDAYAAQFIEPFVAACESHGCPYQCVPVGDTCPAGLECDNVDGGIDFQCVPAPGATKPSSSSCASAPGRRDSIGAWIAIAMGIGLTTARRRARAIRSRVRGRRRRS